MVKTPYNIYIYMYMYIYICMYNIYIYIYVEYIYIYIWLSSPFIGPLCNSFIIPLRSSDPGSSTHVHLLVSTWRSAFKLRPTSLGWGPRACFCGPLFLAFFDSGGVCSMGLCFANVIYLVCIRVQITGPC